MSKNILELNEELQNLVEQIGKEIKAVIEQYDKDMFMSELKVCINEIPLSSFNLLTGGNNVNLQPYDVSEGTQGLTWRLKTGSWTEIVYNSVELSEKSDEVSHD